MSTFNKCSGSKNVTQYATRIKPGDAGKYALLPGDPDRVDRIAKYLDDVREVANNREFKAVTGRYKNIEVTAMSTGIGCPSASIAVEELANVGATHFIRVGSTAGLQKHVKTGDIVINTGVYRNDGTSRAYLPENFSLVADHFLAQSLIEAAIEVRRGQTFNIHVGMNACDDAFYRETPAWIDTLSALNLLNVEMESAAIFAVAHLRGLSAAMVCGVSGNLKFADYDYDKGEKGNTQLVNAWENAIQIALEAIEAYESNQECVSLRLNDGV